MLRHVASQRLTDVSKGLSEFLKLYYYVLSPFISPRILMSCNISIVIITALKTSNIAGKEKKTILTLQINFHIDFILILTLNFHNSAF